MKYIRLYEGNWEDEIRIKFKKNDYVHEYNDSDAIYIIKEVRCKGQQAITKRQKEQNRYKLYYGDTDIQDVFHRWAFEDEIYLAKQEEIDAIKYNL